MMAHITPWEERKYVGGLVRNNEECMLEEINELRAAVAQEAPSVPDGYIRFDYINSDGREDSKVITHDEMRDRYSQHYRAAYANFAAPSAQSVSADPLQDLADQAQELDMGYGPDACPTCLRSGSASPSVIADAKAEEIRRIWAAMPAHLNNEPFVKKAYQAALAACQAESVSADAPEFKNFHRLLCERFDYIHDEVDWKRDQASLIEHIASQAAPSVPDRAQEIQPMPNRRAHELKVWPEFYDALHSGEKTFELRKDDRGFRAGDVLLLREWNPRSETYSGRSMRRLVTYIISGKWGLEKDMVCMALAAPAPSVSAYSKDAERISTLREAVIDAADEWSRYVGADSAPRRCSEHVGMAFDAAIATQSKDGGAA